MSAGLFSALFAALLRLGCGLWLAARMLGAPRWDWRALGVLAGGLVVFVANWPNPLAMVVEVGAMAFCGARFLGLDARLCVCIGVFYEIALALWQFLLAAWLGVAFRTPAFLDAQTAQGEAVLWLLHGALLVLVFVDRRRPFLPPGRRALSLFLVLSFVAVISLSEQRRLTLDDATLDLWTMMVLILMMGVLMLAMRRQVQTEQELAALKAQQAENAERDYQRLSRIYATNARLFHDLHNHLGVLRRFLAQGKGEEALAYLDDLQAPLRALTQTVWTGDTTVDYLIASKAQQAETAGIPFHAEAEFPARSTLRAADLCAILGNLLDNALEGASRASGEQWVSLVMRRIGMMLVIKVENSAQPPQPDLATTKTDGLHGWGLDSARAAAARYDGVVQTHYADGRFTAVATLSFDGVTPS